MKKTYYPDNSIQTMDYIANVIGIDAFFKEKKKSRVDKIQNIYIR